MKKEKNKVSNLLKFGIFLLSISLLLWNCEKEELSIDTIQNIEPELKNVVKKLSLEDLQSKQKLKEPLQNLSRKFDINKAKSKSSKINANDGSFTILTDNIRETATDSTLTYTFLLEKPTLSTSTFENFVIERQRDSTYNFYIYHFEPSIGQKGFPYTITTSLLDKNLIVNTNLVSLFSRGCENGGGYTTIEPVYGLHCDCCDGSCGTHNPKWGITGHEAVWHWNTGCGGSSYSNTSGGSNWSNGNTGGTTNGSTNNNPPSSPVTIIPLTMSQQLSELITLTPEQEFWANKPYNKTKIEEIITFLLNNCGLDNSSTNCQEAEDFIKLGLKAEVEKGEMDLEEKIIIDSTFVNNQRLKCVYDKFKAGDNKISKYLENFLGEKPVGHLNFKADSNFAQNHPNSTTAGAITSPPVNGAINSNVANYNIDIIFNTDSNLPDSSEPNKPTIILAVELIHEMVHAEMYRKLLSSAQLPHVNWQQYTNTQWRNFIYNLRNNYEGLHSYYERYYFNNPNPTSPQHNIMAQHYRDMVKEAIKDFDNNQNTDEFYDALSWIGLKNTVAWNNPNINQTNINNIITNAIANESKDCTN